MSRRNKLPVTAQVAAIQAIMDERSVDLDAVDRQYPQLRDGVAELRAKPAPRRSGATSATQARRPRALHR